MRKTLVSKLKNSGQPRNVICEITSHARESSLDDYDEVNENQRKELSHIISGYKEVPNEIGPNVVFNQTIANEASNQAFAVQRQRAPLVPIHHVQQQGQIHPAMTGFNPGFQPAGCLGSISTKQPSLLLVAPFYRRITLAARSISTPKKSTRSQNHRRNEGLTSLSRIVSLAAVFSIVTQRSYLCGVT